MHVEQVEAIRAPINTRFSNINQCGDSRKGGMMCFINAGFKSAQHPIQRKASSYGSMEGQKTDTFKQQFSEQTKQPINSDGPQEPFKAGQQLDRNHRGGVLHRKFRLT